MQNGHRLTAGERQGRTVCQGSEHDGQAAFQGGPSGESGKRGEARSREGLLIVGVEPTVDTLLCQRGLFQINFPISLHEVFLQGKRKEVIYTEALVITDFFHLFNSTYRVDHPS